MEAGEVHQRIWRKDPSNAVIPRFGGATLVDGNYQLTSAAPSARRQSNCPQEACSRAGSHEVCERDRPEIEVEGDVADVFAHGIINLGQYPRLLTAVRVLYRQRHTSAGQAPPSRDRWLCL